MVLRKLSIALVMAGLGSCFGCATDRPKLPFRDTFANFGSHRNDSQSALSGGASEELSPEFRAAQKEFKKDPEGTLLAWARWQEDMGEYGEARKKYRELLIAYPNNIESQLGLARIELSCGRVKQAEDILLEVARTRPTNSPVRLELGRLYSQQEDWPKAIAAFEDASAIDVENQICRYELGIAFARSHRYDQALSHLTYAVGESAAHYNIGYVLHEQGNNAEAAEWLQNALQTHPDARTADKTHAMLAQLSPKNSRRRNAPPTYPEANPTTPVIAGRAKQTRIDQFEPASFETPVVHTPSAIGAQSSGQVLPYVSSEETSRKYSQPSVLLPPVNLQPAQFGMSTASAQPSIQSNSVNPFQTVSHAVPQEANDQASNSGSQLPRWRGTSQQLPSASQQSPVTETKDIAPAKWRGR